MEGLFAVLLLAVPMLVHGDSLHNACGRHVYASSSLTVYTINSRSNYTSLCKVRFDHPSFFGKVRLTITGNSLDSRKCQVNVYDGNDVFSRTGGNINRLGYFSTAVTSTGATSELYLHVQGSRCDAYGLTFTLKNMPSCTGFTCDSGDCVPIADICDGWDDCADGSDEDGCFLWSAGAYVGASLGVAAFISASVVIAIIFYRRRAVMVRSGIFTPSGQTAITHSRW